MEKAKDLIVSWFEHIEQMATNRKTANGSVMGFQECLDEIRVLAKESQEFMKSYIDEVIEKKNYYLVLSDNEVERKIQFNSKVEAIKSFSEHYKMALEKAQYGKNKEELDENCYDDYDDEYYYCISNIALDYFEEAWVVEESVLNKC